MGSKVFASNASNALPEEGGSVGQEGRAGQSRAEPGISRAEPGRWAGRRGAGQSLAGGRGGGALGTGRRIRFLVKYDNI